MSDTTGDATPNRTPQTDTTGEMLPVATAAVALGITSDAIRARIRRGKMQGEKRGGGWFVFVSDAERRDTDATEHDAGPNIRVAETDREASVTTPNATVVTPSVVDLAPLAGVIRYQEEIIERQSRELVQVNAAAAMWQERARLFEGQLKQLSAGEIVPQIVPEPSGSPRSDDTGARVVLAWLRRLWRG